MGRCHAESSQCDAMLGSNARLDWVLLVRYMDVATCHISSPRRYPSSTVSTDFRICCLPKEGNRRKFEACENWLDPLVRASPSCRAELADTKFMSRHPTRGSKARFPKSRTIPSPRCSNHENDQTGWVLRLLAKVVRTRPFQ